MDKNKWTAEIEQITGDFAKEFGQLSFDELNWKPNDKAWSIAQNIDHLIVLNKTYFPLLQSIHEGKYVLPFIGKIGFLVNYFGKLILKSVQPDRKRKMQTFRIWEPSKSNISADIIERFKAHQTALTQMIRNSDELLDNKTVITSPANPKIVYSLEMAFDIIVAHEKRHLEQAREVKNMLPKN